MSISISKNAVRKMALLLLDDSYGINVEAYEFLSTMLVETGNEDILAAVDITDTQAYVDENFAEAELAKLESPTDDNE